MSMCILVASVLSAIAPGLFSGSGWQIFANTTCLVLFAGVCLLVFLLGNAHRRLIGQDVELAQLRSVVANSSHFIGLASIKGDFLFVNPAGKTLIGLEADNDVAVQQLKLLDLYSEESAELFQKTILPAIKKNLQWQGEVEFRNIKTGACIPIAQTLYVVRKKDPRHSMVLATISRDITDRKRADSERCAKEVAEQANQAKTRFLATISHEIRTPLNAIVGMTDLILETPLNPEQHRCTEVVQSSVHTILDLVNNILDYSKFQQHGQQLETIPFNLASSIETIAEGLAVKAYGKGVEFTWNIEPNVPRLLRGSPSHLNQILFNLLGNAVKFTDHGEVFVSVARENEEEQKVTLRFSVTDTGIGIPHERLGALFSPFVQADGSTTRKYGGTGLGLSISKELVECMGGQIGVTSELGAGSTFWFTLPFEKHNNQADPDAEWVKKYQGFRCLIVDRHPRSRSVLRSILESWRCLCEEAENNSQALRALETASRDNPFRLVFWDRGIPSTEDPEIADEIKAHVGRHHTTFLMLMHLNQSREILQTLPVGFHGHVLKPIARSFLAEAIAVALEDSSQVHTERLTVHAGTTLPQFQARVLVADDQSTNREVVIAMLNKLGVRADSAENGAEAILSLQRGDFDLVLMDCEMPELDGFEATQRIRHGAAGNERNSIPVVAVTAHATQEIRNRCQAAGMNDYVLKPVELRTLAKLLGTWLPAQAKSVALPPEQPPLVNSVVAFNEETLLNRLMGDKKIAKTIVQGFVQEFPTRLVQVRSLLEKQDACGVRREAHAIKGAAATISAERLREIGLAMEEAATEGHLQKVTAFLPSLEEEFTAFRAALRSCPWIHDETAKGALR